MQEALRRKPAVICEMDGVPYDGNRLLPGALEFIEWLKAEGKKFLFLTNSSESSPRELLDHVIILSEQHLRSLLKEFIEEYYDQERPHHPGRACNTVPQAIPGRREPEFLCYSLFFGENPLNRVLSPNTLARIKTWRHAVLVRDGR